MEKLETSLQSSEEAIAMIRGELEGEKVKSQALEKNKIEVCKKGDQHSS